MKLGICKNCRQRAELHEDVDGSWVCEDDLLKNSSRKQVLDRAMKARPLSGVEGGEFAPATRFPVPDNGQRMAPQSQKPRREVLLDYVVSHAKADWIEDFVTSHKERLRRDFGWVKLLEAEQNERILFRIATELGYAEEKPKTKEARKVYVPIIRKRGMPRRSEKGRYITEEELRAKAKVEAKKELAEELDLSGVGPRGPKKASEPAPGAEKQTASEPA